MTHDSQHHDGDISTVYGDNNQSVSRMFGELILIKYYDFLLCPVTRGPRAGLCCAAPTPGGTRGHTGNEQGPLCPHLCRRVPAPECVPTRAGNEDSQSLYNQLY